MALIIVSFFLSIYRKKLYIRSMVKDIKTTDRIVVDLEMLQIDYNEQKKNTLRHGIANKYNVPLKNVEVNFKPITVDENGNRISLADEVRENIQDAGHQKQLMKDYIALKQYEDVDWNDINLIDNEVNSYVDLDQYNKYKNYKFKYVKWDNYLSYGEGNFFDFTKLHGLVLLNSDPANQGGKTTFAIDLLRFALFGRADKSPNLDSVFNKFNDEATTVLVEACIEIDSIDYVIRRTVTRPALKKRTEKSKCKQKLEYFRKFGDELELIENCEGESVQQTNNIIKEAVGDVEDFNLVISATQYSLGELLRMGNTDKGKLFSRWLGLLSIEEKERVAKELWKNNHAKQLLSNTYNKETLKEEIGDYQTCNSDLAERIKFASEAIQTATENLINYNKSKTDILLQLKPIIDDLDTIDVTTLDNETEMYNQELAAKRADFKQQKIDYDEVKDATYDPDEMENAIVEQNQIQEDINNINLKIGEVKGVIFSLRDEKNRMKNLAEQGICPTCHHEIDLFEYTKQKNEIEGKENGYIEEGVALDKEREKLNERLNKTNELIKVLKEAETKYRSKENLDTKLRATKLNIENLKSKIEANTKIKNQIKANEDNIKYNSEIRAKALIIDESINNETLIKEEKIRELEGYNSNVAANKKQIELRKDLIDKLEKEEKVIRNWNIYLELVGKNGIIKLVLKKNLPAINNEISRIMNGLVDFETVLSVDDKNNVVINLVKDGKNLDMGISGSGFETTIASLALRSALASISTMSKPNFIVFDEVLGQTADCNMNAIHEIFNRIMSNYDFVLNITHNENIYDWHDGGTITVTKVDNISKIK